MKTESSTYLQQVARFVYPPFRHHRERQVVGRNDSMRFWTNDWAPRGHCLGPVGDLVIRAGYGIFYGLQQ